MIGGGSIVGSAGAVIKSIQRGISAGTSAVTITSVSLADAILRVLGWTTNNDTQDLDFARMAFTNATTLTPTVNTGGGLNGLSWEVTEYQPGAIKSIQRGTIGSLTTATITAVDTSKSELHILGNTTTSATTGDQAHTTITLTNSTTITSGAAGGLNTTTGWEVVEFY